MAKRKSAASPSLSSGKKAKRPAGPGRNVAPKAAGRAAKKSRAAGRPPAEVGLARAQVADRGTAAQAARRSFHVVGIGASAGGLDALERFFSHMPPDSGMAFVVISHLSPGHVSVMPELLRKFTGMDVFQIESGMRLRPNTIYVTPPNKDVAVMSKTFRLMSASEHRGLRLPIDYFFRSLAQDLEDKAVAVILSGSGSDGTSGVREIKADLGLVVVQDPASAKYDGMPRSAIATGIVDYVLPADLIPGRLLKYVQHVPLLEPRRESVDHERTSDSLQRVLILIRDQTGHDFSFYKRNTTRRRIERRMNVHQIDTIAHYAAYLERNPNEVKILFQELLIGVTSFFRDPKAFEALKRWVMSYIIKDKPADYVFRLWVPGCSSGEEAYSLAIILRECLDEAKKKLQVQIFGTDIDTKAVEKARAGRYPFGISADVTPERLTRYFIKRDSFYEVRKEIREMVIFAPQNVIKDPPFIKLDLLACRNLLIYLENEVQKKLIPLFHYALRPSGILFLGTSETIGDFMDLFSQLDKKWRIFLRRETAVGAQVDLPPLRLKERTKTLPPREPMPFRRPVKPNIAQLAEKVILEKLSPPSIVINQKGDILYVHGRTGRFLEPAPGEGGFMNIFRMSREGLRLELMGAMRKAKAPSRGWTTGPRPRD
jgi:two-component system CheB/CheR fusion protein